MRRYENGEIATCERIELEAWYPYYQDMMEIAVREMVEDCDLLAKMFWERNPEAELSKERVLRWAVLHASIQGRMPKDLKEELIKDGYGPPKRGDYAGT